MYIYMDQAGSCTACRQWFIPDMGSYRTVERTSQLDAAHALRHRNRSRCPLTKLFPSSQPIPRPPLRALLLQLGHYSA